MFFEHRANLNCMAFDGINGVPHTDGQVCGGRRGGILSD